MNTRLKQWLIYGGCFVVLLLLGAGFFLLLTGPVGWMLVTGAAFVLLVAGGAQYAKRWRATHGFRTRYGPEGKDVLIVYTNSHLWAEHIEANWIPRWGDRAVVLNRSRPWQEGTPEARLWRMVAGTVEHTPVVIVVPKRGAAKAVRFLLAFRDRRDREKDVRDAEAEVERLLR